MVSESWQVGDLEFSTKCSMLSTCDNLRGNARELGEGEVREDNLQADAHEDLGERAETKPDHIFGLMI